MAITARTRRAERALGSRAGAVAVALWWAVLFFGLIDLLVGIIPSEFPDFSSFVVVETSWGLLYTVLVPVPLIAWAVRPAGWVGPQVVAVAAGVLVAGVGAGAVGQMFVALLVAASTALPRMWRPRPAWSMHRVVATPAFWPVGVLVALGLGAALVHAWDVLDTARSGARDDDTWYLMHLPMQAGFALAIPAAAAVGALAMANRVTSWWFAIVPPAASAVWFGVVCASHPDLLGSPGAAAGWCTAAWGMATAVAVWATGYRTRPAAVSHASGSRCRRQEARQDGTASSIRVAVSIAEGALRGAGEVCWLGAAWVLAASFSGVQPGPESGVPKSVPAETNGATRKPTVATA